MTGCECCGGRGRSLLLLLLQGGWGSPCIRGLSRLLPFPGLAKAPHPRRFSPNSVGSQETQRRTDPGASLVQGEPGQELSTWQQWCSPEPAVGSVGHRCTLTLQTLAKGKVISTDHLKLFLSRRKWQVKAGVWAGVRAGRGQADLCAGQDGVMCAGQDDAVPPTQV